MKIVQLLHRLGLWPTEPINVEAVNAYTQRICALPFEEARLQAYTRLEQSPDYELEFADPNEDVPDPAPEGLVDLFNRYRTVDWKGIARVSLDDWLPCADIPHCYFIGEDTGCPLVVRSKQNAVYILNGDRFTSEYPSVFHWILVLSEEPTLSVLGDKTT